MEERESTTGIQVSVEGIGGGGVGVGGVRDIGGEGVGV